MDRLKLLAAKLHNYFVIISAKTGNGIHLGDLDEYELRDSTVYCITPSQIHLLNFNAPVDGYVVSFTIELMK